MKFKKLLSVILIFVICFTSVYVLTEKNSLVSANDIIDKKVGDSIIIDSREQYIVVVKDEYLITEYVENENIIYSVIPKHSTNLTSNEYANLLDQAKADISARYLN